MMCLFVVLVVICLFCSEKKSHLFCSCCQPISTPQIAVRVQFASIESETGTSAPPQQLMLCRSCVLCAHCGVSRIAARLTVAVRPTADAAERRTVSVYVCSECCAEYEAEKAKLALRRAQLEEEIDAQLEGDDSDGSELVNDVSEVDESVIEESDDSDDTASNVSDVSGDSMFLATSDDDSSEFWAQQGEGDDDDDDDDDDVDEDDEVDNFNLKN